MPPFELHQPKSVSEACAIAKELMLAGDEFDWIAGGTDLIPNYKWHINSKLYDSESICIMATSWSTSQSAVH